MSSVLSGDPPRSRTVPSKGRWTSFFKRNSTLPGTNSHEMDEDKGTPTKWSMGVLNDRLTHEVPGSVLLLTGARNEPLGMHNAPARTSTSSVPASIPIPIQRQSLHESKKKTPDGTIILEPQPDDSHNDPLNWPAWRRDSALLSLGFYCLVGGGMTPVLAAGFTNVADDFDVAVPQVALTTGLYMMGLGVGSVFASPTAILYGKRPVYLFGCILFIGCSAWCAASPSYSSLVAARVLQGVALSPVECLPSATIAEIFFLHERAYRVGIYTLLLLGGKNLVPLVSAAIIQTLSWRWVFWIVSMIGGFCFVLLFLFVPETFWDRTPRPKSRRNPQNSIGTKSAWSLKRSHTRKAVGGGTDGPTDEKYSHEDMATESTLLPRVHKNKARRDLHVGFAATTSNNGLDFDHSTQTEGVHGLSSGHLVEFRPSTRGNRAPDSVGSEEEQIKSSGEAKMSQREDFGVRGRTSTIPAHHDLENRIAPTDLAPPTPGLHNFNSPFYVGVERSDSDYLSRGRANNSDQTDGGKSIPNDTSLPGLPDSARPPLPDDQFERPERPPRYTTFLKEQPRQTFSQQLKPWNGRLHNDNWLRVAFRPFILFCYPAVLWSAVVYACSVGWLIVLSESVAEIYRSKETYNFSALSAGLVYLSPFIGGILGTAVAGKVSDVIVKFMSRRNGGLYEPEFRLVMAFPVAITTVIGLMGFGWSAQNHDAWIVPTVFFGVISFGCSLGSTTAITFCVDSYRQYAGEALVTLNFSKNIFHGLVFSLFFNSWLAADGARAVFLALGGIQLALLAFTIPMYIYGKRARMWTVRMNLMERF